jgi:hypothetical protein
LRNWNPQMRRRKYTQTRVEKFPAAGHGSVITDRGTVLVVGGGATFGDGTSAWGTAISEYDPIGNSWKQIGNTLKTRRFPTVSRLGNGKYLVTGGGGDTSEIIDLNAKSADSDVSDTTSVPISK